MTTITKDTLTKELIEDFHIKFFSKGLKIIYPDLSINQFKELLKLVQVFYRVDIDSDYKRNDYTVFITKKIYDIHKELNYNSESSNRKYRELLDLLSEAAQETHMFISNNQTISLFGSNQPNSIFNIKE